MSHALAHTWLRACLGQTLLLVCGIAALLAGQVDPKAQSTLASSGKTDSLFAGLNPNPGIARGARRAKIQRERCASQRQAEHIEVNDTTPLKRVTLFDCPGFSACMGNYLLIVPASPGCGSGCPFVNNYESDPEHAGYIDGIVEDYVGCGTTCCVTNDWCENTGQCLEECNFSIDAGVPETWPDPCTYPFSQGCAYGWYRASGGGCCRQGSPIIVDVDGSGFQLTSAANGVSFDLTGTGTPVQFSWTALGSTNAWLVLDRNGNGQIDSGREMFGNFTEQPNAPNANGFLALAEYDKTAKGGNGDGLISSGDAIFAELQLWIDSNHNGFSENEELFTLPSQNVDSIELTYKESKWQDAYGNVFKYRAKVNSKGPKGGAGRWAYDVFLLAYKPPSQTN